MIIPDKAWISVLLKEEKYDEVHEAIRQGKPVNSSHEDFAEGLEPIEVIYELLASGVTDKRLEVAYHLLLNGADPVKFDLHEEFVKFATDHDHAGIREIMAAMILDEEQEE